MSIRTLSKIGAVALICAAFALVANTASVADVTVGASEKAPVEAFSDTSDLFSAAKKTLSPIRKKKKVTTKRPYLATVLSAQEEEALLPAVAQKDITLNHQHIADDVLRALPPHCRTFLKNFYVIYKDPTSRGLGGKTTIILDGSVPNDEFAALLTHECGHVTHGNMPGTIQSGSSNFKDGKNIFNADSPVVSFFSISWKDESNKKKNSSTKDFVSGYASSDAFEDFAETFAMYILHRPALRERAKKNDAIKAKLMWMETYLPINENALGTSTYTWKGEVPWDVTKLSYKQLIAVQ